MDDKKRKSLEEVLAHIEKNFGKGSIMNMDGTNKVKVDVIPTGCLAYRRTAEGKDNRDIRTGVFG